MQMAQALLLTRQLGKAGYSQVEGKEVRRLGVANGETWPWPSPQVKTNKMIS